MRLRAADLFCGAGGTSQGARQTGAVDIAFALNHWHRAIETHRANFPDTVHVNSRLENTSPSEASGINLLFASPECTHHSRARGGRPTSDQQRSGAWHVLPWIEHHRPSWVVIENVTEFKDWGPIGANGQPLKTHRGSMFSAWVKSIESMGYKVDHRELNAADYGAATSRNRLFVIARKGKSMPVFPKPTHAKPSLPFFCNLNRQPWRAAAEIIDWTIPCPSIFVRQRDLADKTLLRIEAGLRRFVGPFVSSFHCGADSARRNHSPADPVPTLDTSNRFGLALPYSVVFRNNMTADDIRDPLNTITAGGGHHGIATPYIIPNFGERDRQAPRTHAIDQPTPCVTSHGAGCLVTPFVPDSDDETWERHQRLLQQWRDWPDDEQETDGRFVLSTGSGGAPRHTGGPLPTIVTRDGTALVIPWLAHYYGTDNQSPVTDPADTITTKERHSLCMAICRGPEDWPAPTSDAMRKLQATMKELRVCDIGFRMLANPELSAAQGFPSDYQFHGTKAEITRQVGNSVSPSVAEAISRAILAT